MSAIARIAACTALMATCGIALAEDDYASLKVVGSTVMEMRAGPGNTGVLLSPDGNRALHIDLSEVCLLAPAQIGSWAVIGCIEGPLQRGAKTCSGRRPVTGY